MGDDIAGGHPPLGIGTTMDVLYNPDSPTMIITYPKNKLETIPNFLIAIGAIGVTVCVAGALLKEFGMLPNIPT